MTVTLKNRLPQVAAKLRPKVSEAVKESADAVADAARINVPVDSGDLKESIHVERRGSAEYAVVAGNHDIYYGHLVEFGSSATRQGRGPIGPRPFLTPALELERTRIEVRVNAALRDL